MRVSLCVQMRLDMFVWPPYEGEEDVGVWRGRREVAVTTCLTAARAALASLYVSSVTDLCGAPIQNTQHSPNGDLR